MKAKRLLCGVLVLGMIGTLLVGCGKNKTTHGDTKTITWWSSSAGSKAFYESAVDEFNETTGKEIGVKINFEIKDMGQAFEVAALNKEEPELFGGVGLQKAVEQGYVIALEDIEGGKALVDKIDPADMKENKNTYKGKTYTLPVEASFCSLLYNKDLFKRAGIVDEKGDAKPPKTWTEFREAAQKINALGENIYGVAYPLKFSGWFTYDIALNVYNETGYSTYNWQNGEYDASGYIPWLQSVVDNINDGSAYPGSEMLDNDPARARFAEGQIGMKFAFSWDYDVITKQFPAKCDWGVTVCPVVDENNRHYQLKDQMESFMIGRKMKEILTDEQIIAIMDYFTNDAFQLKKYEAGVAFPWNSDVISQADASKISTGWKEWGEVLPACMPRPVAPPLDMSNERSLNEMFRSEILTGNKTTEQVIDEYTAALKRGRARYLQLHPEDAEINYVHPDFDAKMK